MDWQCEVREKPCWRDRSGGQVEGGRPMVQLRQLRLALAQSNIRGTLGSVSQQRSPTVPTTQPQWTYKRVSVSPELCPEQWPRSPSTSIITPSTQKGHNAPYWLKWHSNTPRSRYRRPALSASGRWTNPPVTTRLCSPWLPSLSAENLPRPTQTHSHPSIVAYKGSLCSRIDNKRY